MEAVEIAGQRVETDQKVTIWEMSANRDERKFDDPFRFDIARKPNRHIGFGAGVHFCLGANLARMEIRTMLTELMRRYKGFDLAGDPEWTPSNRLLGLSHQQVRNEHQGGRARLPHAQPPHRSHHPPHHISDTTRPTHRTALCGAVGAAGGCGPTALGHPHASPRAQRQRHRQRQQQRRDPGPPPAWALAPRPSPPAVARHKN